MSMQAYLDNITAKTGKTPEEFVALARDRGLLEPGVKAGQIIAWLKDFGLGRGHAMAIVATIKKQTNPEVGTDEKVAAHFTGKKAEWRSACDELVTAVAGLGPDTDVTPGKSYLSLRRNGKKFAIIQVTAGRLDLGLKLKNAAANGRLEPAGSWNAMVTHRVRILRARDLDDEVFTWLREAYECA